MKSALRGKTISTVEVSKVSLLDSGCTSTIATCWYRSSSSRGSRTPRYGRSQPWRDPAPPPSLARPRYRSRARVHRAPGAVPAHEPCAAWPASAAGAVAASAITESQPVISEAGARLRLPESFRRPRQPRARLAWAVAVAVAIRVPRAAWATRATGARSAGRVGWAVRPEAPVG